MSWRGPSYRGELPTLGYAILDWITEYLIVPDGPTAGDPLEFTPEQAQFILDFYVVDPKFTGSPIRGRSLVNARRVRRAVLSRSKGWGKSPLLAALCLAEALADVVPDGWDEDGEPVGRPWASLGFKPKVQVVAVSEDQTNNTWDPLLEMARNGPVGVAYDIEALETFVSVPRGRIEYTTSAAVSREGFRPVFGAFDQTESWKPSNGGVTLAQTIRRNLAKVQGSSIEAPNAFIPGEKSVSENSFKAWQEQLAGRLKGEDGILVDHREAPADTDPHDRASLVRGLIHAYGDSIDARGGWVALERLVQDYWDPDTDPQKARMFFLNQITHAVDAWVSQPEWKARYNRDAVLADADIITMGFDGSRGRRRGMADATALIGCRVVDGYEFEIGIWQQVPGRPWVSPEHLVDAAVQRTFDRFNVVGFFADPTMYDEHCARWESKYGPRLKVKASGSSKIRFPKNQMTRVIAGLKSMHAAILNGELSHDGSEMFEQHVVNARRRVYRSGVYIAKEHEASQNKIDAAYAGMLAWLARLDAVAAGLHVPKTLTVPGRIR